MHVTSVKHILSTHLLNHRKSISNNALHGIQYVPKIIATRQRKQEPM